jgi:outer membrane protein assembly factor BamA
MDSFAPALRHRLEMIGRHRALPCALALSLAFLVAPRVVHAQGTDCESGEPEVRSLEFHGNRAFRSSDLALRIVTSPSDLLRQSLRIVGAKHCLDSDELKLDVARLRVFYRRHGYYSTKVDTAVTPMTDGFGGVRVSFTIQEGRPVYVDTLQLTGLSPAIAAIVDTSDLDLRPGIVFDATRLQASIDSMKARLRDNGYPRGDVAASFTPPDTIKRRVAVRLDVIPGARARIGSIRVLAEPLLPGSPLRIGEGTIERLIEVRPGDIYSERELTDAQRKLYQTDLFRHVDVGIVTDSASSRNDTLITIQVHTAENYLHQLDYELGWAVLDCLKARVQYVDKNFLGEARRVDFQAQVSKIGWGEPTRFAAGSLCAPAIRADTFSAKLNYYTGATLRLQSLFGLRTHPTLTVFSERRGEYQAFLRTTLIGGEASVTQEIRRAVPVRYAYSLEYGRTEAQPALLCAVFNRCDAESRAQITDRDRPLAVASAHLDRVRTDDAVNPRFGTTLRLDLRGAAKEIGSDRDIQFIKGLLDASLYRGFGRSFTFASRLRLGTVLGRNLSFEDPVGFIPPQERLYAGGASSVRGFQQNELGDLIYIAESAPTITPGKTADTAYLEVPANSSERRVVPVGGNSLIVANFELRMRSPVLSDLIQYTVFADGGDVWQRELATGTSAHKASALFLNQMKWTPGIGIRISTPVGPFQANVGYNPFVRPPGAIYYDQAPNSRGFAPLYCVSPGNRVPAVYDSAGNLEQLSGFTCPATFQPPQANTFFGKLTFTFSIGPDF